jgi:hypothetical protein
MEHYRYQGQILDVAAPYPLGDTQPHGLLGTQSKKFTGSDPETENLLLAFMLLSGRKRPLADGFSPADVDADFKKRSVTELVQGLWTEREKTAADMKSSTHGITVLFYLTWGFYELESYRQEVPLGFLDLLELSARKKQIEKYAAWMLKKGFEYVAFLCVLLIPVSHEISQRIDQPQRQNWLG